MGFERPVEKPKEREGWEISNFEFRNVALLCSVSVNLAELRRVAPKGDQVRSELQGWHQARSQDARQGRLRGRGHGRLLSKGRDRGARKAGQSG